MVRTENGWKIAAVGVVDGVRPGSTAAEKEGRPRKLDENAGRPRHSGKRTTTYAIGMSIRVESLQQVIELH
jgi:hypothetical protein